MNHLRRAICGAILASLIGTAAVAQVLATSSPQMPNKWGYAYDNAYDAVKAAPDVHRLKYEDEHIQFLEVANPPGYHMQMHGHPYPSVFARSSVGTIVNNLGPRERFLDPDSALNGQAWRNGPAPRGQSFPTCTAANPQAPHLPYNGSDTPLHFYRIEFKRIEQDDPAQLNDRYAGHPLERIRYEDASVRLVEVTLGPRRSASLYVDRYPAVLAFDTVNAFEAVSQQAGETAGRSDPPSGMVMPRCMTTTAKGPHALTNRGDLPIHYYRIDLKRIDAQGLRDHWREWYPYMLKMQQAAP